MNGAPRVVVIVMKLLGCTDGSFEYGKLNSAMLVEVRSRDSCFTTVYIFDPTLYVSIVSSNLLFSHHTPRFRSIFSNANGTGFTPNLQYPFSRQSIRLNQLLLTNQYNHVLLCASVRLYCPFNASIRSAYVFRQGDAHNADTPRDSNLMAYMGCKIRTSF